MKKILLMIFLTLAIFQMVTLATDIYIGAPAINRGTTLGAYTFINNNVANETGIITSVEIWSDTDLVNCEVATFFNIGGNTFTTRDTEYIGAVEDDAKRTFSVDLDVEAGDYIGIYYTAGYIERDNSGCDGMWIKSGDNIPCADITFTNYVTSAISLYGTGTTDIGWPHKWNTQTITKWDNQEFTKWNRLE